jgi:hypothetical protein
MAALHVSGDESPPGVTLAVARAVLMELGREHDDPSSILAAANDALARTALDRGGSTVSCGLLVAGPEGEVQWACAGPLHAGVIRREGAFDELPSHGPPLGLLQGFRYGTATPALGSGDELLVLAGASPGLFRGATDLVAALAGKPAGEIVATVQKAIRKAQEEHPIANTVLFLRKH